MRESGCGGVGPSCRKGRESASEGGDFVNGFADWRARRSAGDTAEDLAADEAATEGSVASSSDDCMCCEAGYSVVVVGMAEP